MAISNLYHLELQVSCSNGTERDGTFVDVGTFAPTPTGISEGDSFQLVSDGVRAGTVHAIREWRRAGQSYIGYLNPDHAAEDAIAVSRILTERIATDYLDPEQSVMLFLGNAPWRQSTVRLAHVVWFTVVVWRQQPTGGDDLLMRI